LEEVNGKITLPKELQKQMLKFFLKTSIPRIHEGKGQKLQTIDPDEAKNSKRDFFNVCRQEFFHE